MQRMLMLQHRSLFGDRPLPLFSADGSHDTAEVGSCSTGTSAWAIQFAAEQANPQGRRQVRRRPLLPSFRCPRGRAHRSQVMHRVHTL